MDDPDTIKERVDETLDRYDHEKASLVTYLGKGKTEGGVVVAIEGDAASAIYELCKHIGGHPETTPRGYIDGLLAAFHKAQTVGTPIKMTAKMVLKEDVQTLGGIKSLGEIKYLDLEFEEERYRDEDE